MRSLTQHDQKGKDRDAGRPRPWRARPLGGRLILALLVSAGLAFAIGFIDFADTVTRYEQATPSDRADAIVALTGGPSRITDAVALLGAGRGNRLLISGVYPDTDRGTLARMVPGRGELFECCIDLGYAALNTAGNAQETRDWARNHGYRSLIIVTSSYHLPRSLTELRRQLPEARLIPYAVINEGINVGEWWRNQRTARLLLSEYAKYLMSIAELRFGRPATAAEVAFAGRAG